MNQLFRLNPLSLTIRTPDIATPVDPDILKAHLAVDGSSLDDLLAVYLQAATTWAEGSMHRSIMARSHEWVLKDFPRRCNRLDTEEIVLPRGLTQSVDSITYTDSGGTSRTMYGPSSGSPTQSVSFQEDLRSDDGGRLRPIRGRCWPSVDCEAVSPVVITFRAGWEDPVDVPAPITHALMFACSDMLEMRGTADLAVLQSIASSGKTFDAREALISQYVVRTVY